MIEKPLSLECAGSGAKNVLNATNAVEEIRQRLFALRDPEYAVFQRKLMPTIDAETVIGVRTPELRKFAKQLAGMLEAEVFLTVLPHVYYEENNLHAFLIELIRDYDACIHALNTFLPYVNNWATCDCMAPRVLQKNLAKLFSSISQWLSSDHAYTIRFGIGMLMRYYLDDAFDPEYPKKIVALHSNEYYVNMMIAWYFATALAKQYDTILPYFTNLTLEPWIHNKSIQKALESRRISPERKNFLRKLRV